MFKGKSELCVCNMSAKIQINRNKTDNKTNSGNQGIGLFHLYKLDVNGHIE